MIAWWLGEARAADVKRALDSADAVMASELTIIECERVLVRGLALGSLTEIDASGRRATLQSVISGWTQIRMDGEILDRAKRGASRPDDCHPLPNDPQKLPLEIRRNQSLCVLR